MFNQACTNCRALTDSHGRKISSFRISLTNRCNLNCIFCHREGYNSNNSNSEISKQTILNIIFTGLEYGIDKVKFTGGEPLLRSDLEEIIAALPKLEDISMTTNGVLLSLRARDLVESGLHRVNVNLPSLCSEKYDLITRSRNMLSRVLDGIHCALDTGLTPLKINMVLLNGINNNEIEEMIAFARRCNLRYKENVCIQLIELIDFNGLAHLKLDLAEIEKWLEARSVKIWERSLHRRRRYLIDDIEVEVVKPVNNPVFCASCSRLRVTSDGKLKPCLMRNDNLVDISSSSDGELSSLLELAVSLREPYYKDGLVLKEKGL